MYVGQYIIKRVLQAVPVVLGVTVITFFLIHLVPGDPVTTILGIHRTAAAAANLRRQLGLDRPLLAQYGLFMSRLLHGNLGQSIVNQVSVASLIASHLPVTLFLIGYIVVLAPVVAVPVALVAATHRDRPIDHVIRAVPVVGLGMPAFWIGIMLIILLAVGLQAFPVGGYGSGFSGHVRSLFLPALTGAIAIIPLLIRSLRESAIEVLGLDYVTTARAKGLGSARVLTQHVLRNALPPMITVFGINIAFFVGATVVIENVFALPGLGQLMVTAGLERDYPVVQGVALVLAILVVCVNLVTDIAHALLDPRIGFDRGYR